MAWTDAGSMGRTRVPLTGDLEPELSHSLPGGMSTSLVSHFKGEGSLKSSSFEKKVEIKRLIFNSLLKRALPRLSACHAPESQQSPLWTQSGAQGDFSRPDGMQEIPGWASRQARPAHHPPSQSWQFCTAALPPLFLLTTRLTVPLPLNWLASLICLSVIVIIRPRT